MAGKTSLFFILCYICLSLAQTQTSHRKAYLRSGLLFEKHHTEPILVNPTQLTFYRNLNLTLLLQSNQLLQYYTKAYIEFCEVIRGSTLSTTNEHTKKPKQYFFLENKHTASQAEHACFKHNAKLPEIKSTADIEAIKLIAMQNKKYVFPTGITYDTSSKVFRFMSNKEIVPFSPDTFETIAIHNNGTHDEHLTIQANLLHYMAAAHKIFYEFCPNKKPILKLYGFLTDRILYATLCEKLSPEELKPKTNNLLLQITSHICLRDFQGLNATTLLIGKELQAFTKSPKTRIARESNATKTIECYSKICTDLSTTLHLIDQHNHIFNKINNSDIQAKFLVIYHTLKLHNFTTLSNYQQFLYTIFSSETSVTFIRPIPDAEIIYFHAKELTNIANSRQNFTILSLKNKYSYNQHLILIANSSNPETYFLENIASDLKHIRTKRNPILAVGGGIMAANAVTSIFTGESPLSWFGNILSSTLGLASKADIKNVILHLQHHATALTDIVINQEQLHNSYLNIRKNVLNIQDITAQMEYGTANMAVELDNKLAIKNLQVVMQLTLLKIASAFTAAQQHKASPYIFSQDELDTIASTVRNKKIFLSTSMNDVIVNVVQNNSNILFIFTIPVLDERSMFNFYEAKTIPIFEHDKSYIANSDLQFFAITANTNEYSVVSESEYYFCLTQKQCQISDVIHPINSDSHCTIQTFQENKQVCELIPTQTPQKPFFAFYGNKTFFSVPQPVAIRITCQETPLSYVTDSQTKTVSGTGFIEIKPSCTIVLPDSRKYFSNPILEAEYLENSNFMAILKESQPTILNFSFHIPKPTQATTETPVTLKPIELSVIQQIIHEISQPAKSLSAAAIFFIIILIITILAIIPCIFSKCCRTWFTTCTLMKNPKSWWTEYKNYDLSNFTKLNRSSYFKFLQKFRKNKFTRPTEDINFAYSYQQAHNPDTQLQQHQPYTTVTLPEHPDTSYTQRYTVTPQLHDPPTPTLVYPQFRFHTRTQDIRNERPSPVHIPPINNSE